jgi:hypothetical protein
VWPVGVLVAVVVMALVAVEVGGLLQPTALCAESYGEEWAAVENETLREQLDARAVCEAPNGSREPIRLKGVSGDVARATAEVGG